MRTVLSTFAALSLLASLGSCTLGKGPVSDIEGTIWMLIFAVFCVGAALIEHLEKLGKTVEETARRSPSP